MNQSQKTQNKTEKQTTSSRNTQDTATEGLAQQIESLSSQLESINEELSQARKREQLALADYKNLVRRTQEERGKVARLAARNFTEDLLQPLSHLSMAADQLHDAGLDMVVSQLWQALEQNGLKKIEALGKPFDVETMEATETGEHGQKVVKVVQDGYTLNGEVIQHAKVILD